MVWNRLKRMECCGIGAAVLAPVLAVAALCASVPASAVTTAVQDAQAQIAKGDYDGALGQLERYLGTTPQDADARFARGVVLAKLNRVDDAIKAFNDLIRDYPQLPEPYNNLAVLEAQKGDYEKARQALESALATHPAYATAHENLGDVYAELASKSYNRALELDHGNQSVRYKLSLINKLDNGIRGNAEAPAGPAAPAGPFTEAESHAAQAEPQLAPPPPEEPAAAATADYSDPAAQPAVDALQAWAQAWAGRNADAYLSFYGADFVPAGGVSRSDWEAQRRDRITKPAHIEVTLLHTRASRLDPHTVQIRFTQVYHSDRYSDRTAKLVQMSDAGGSWKIVSEAKAK